VTLIREAFNLLQVCSSSSSSRCLCIYTCIYASLLMLVHILTVLIIFRYTHTHNTTAQPRTLFYHRPGEKKEQIPAHHPSSSSSSLLAWWE